MKELLERYPMLKCCAEDIDLIADLIIRSYEHGGKLLICGNGGSSADSDHIAGELMKGFMKKRHLSEEKKQKMRLRYPSIEEDTLDGLQMALPAIPLSSFGALCSAFSNDEDPSLVYAQGVMALGAERDVLLAISTSGNSKNVIEAARVAKSLGMTVLGLSGQTGGILRDVADACVCVPERETYKIQELHLPVYHYVCAKIEEHFFDT